MKTPSPQKIHRNNVKFAEMLSKIIKVWSQAYLSQNFGHFESANSVHVWGHDRDSIIHLFGVSEDVTAMEIHL